MEGYKKFKGTSAEYVNLHNKIRNSVKKPDKCSLCPKSKRLELANKSGKYKEIISDWFWLCGSCHKKHDSKNYFWKGEWWKLCTLCKEIKKCDEFYQRKGILKSRGHIYQREDYTCWCKRCTYNYFSLKKKI